MNPPPALLLVCRLLLLLHVVVFYVNGSACPKSCANLDISYPFGAAPSCGAPGFQLYCDSPSNYPIWKMPLGNPFVNYTVLDIANFHDNGSITLLLPASNSGLPCTPTPKNVVNGSNPPSSAYPFDGVNLSDFTPFANFSFSSHDVFFFFGCNTDQIARNHNNMVVNSSDCFNVLKTCSISSTPSCAQFLIPANMQLLNWTFFWDDLGCVGYESFLEAQLHDIAQLNYMSTQLSWSNVSHNSQCIACEQSGGTCGYDVSDYSFRCFCSGETYDNNCPPQGCIGAILCSTGTKIAAFGVPSALVIASITVCFVCLITKKRSVRDGVPNPSNNSSSSGRSKPFSSEHSFQKVLVKRFSLDELQHATDFFSDDRIIGQGGFGLVYKGTLEDRRKVAVKSLFPDRFTRMETFFNEIRILSSLRHKNLVTLYGFCCDGDKFLLLVFEYVSNGTLAEHLHKGDHEGLPWSVRLDIACETAEALSYLHNSVTPPIFHRDVKSSNILLDENHHAKLADFGISRIAPFQASHISTAPQGTPGYLDPEYFKTYQLTDKSDVYSFGVVLLELVSGKLPVDMSRSSDDVNLARFAQARIAAGTWYESLVDPRLGIHLYPEVENMAGRVLHLASKCLAKRKDKRPTMKDVAETLAEIRRFGYGGCKIETQVEIFYGMPEADGMINSRADHTVESPWTSCSMSPGLSTSHVATLLEHSK